MYRFTSRSGRLFDVMPLAVCTTTSPFASSILGRYGRDNSYYIENPEWHSVYSMVYYVAQDLAATYVCPEPAAQKQTATASTEQPVIRTSEQATSTGSDFPEDQLPDDAFAGTTQTLIDVEEIETKAQEPPKKVSRRSGTKRKDKGNGFFAKLFSGGLIFPEDDVDE